MPVVTDPSRFPAHWAQCVNDGRLDAVIALYHPDAVLMPTFSPHAAATPDAVKDYFTQLATRQGLAVSLHDNTVHALQTGPQGHVVNGIYDFRFDVDGALLTFPSRFTFVIDLALDSPILHHHSSQIPRTLS